MLFNSIEYAYFFPIVFILYWSFKPEKYRWQNIILIIASYIFYGAWDYRFLFLLIFSTSLDYFTGLMIFNSKTKNLKKLWLWISIGINLGFLGFFKYYNFFVESFAELLTMCGFQANISTLHIILPIGISFYTFHGLSYVLDIYNDKIEPTKNIVDYSLFVCFFPLLVAGPIERATHLLPQVKRPRSFVYSSAVDGLKQMLWGFFKKMVIADNCAIWVDQIFENHEKLPASSLVLGAVLFTFQIYGDFSGYSDIALGSARMLGIELLQNFSFPYFSRDLGEFWRRWHISLNTWFRDYLYIPLGGSRGTKAQTIRNTLIVFLVSGFWHGANWTFIFWGFLHFLFFLPLLLRGKNRKNLNNPAQNKLLPGIKELIQMITTFSIVAFTRIFFRAESISDAFSYIKGICSKSILSVPKELNIPLVLLILLFMVIEWLNRDQKYALTLHQVKSQPIRWMAYAAVISIILWKGTSHQSFIYFQF